MTAEQIDLAIKAITFILSALAIVVAWFRTRGRVTDDKIAKIADKVEIVRDGFRDRLDRHESRLQSVEQTVRGMPGREDMHQLQLELAKVAGSLQTMSAVMEGNQQIMRRLEVVVNRHEDHLLAEGAKK